MEFERDRERERVKMFLGFGRALFRAGAGVFGKNVNALVGTALRADAGVHTVQVLAMIVVRLSSSFFQSNGTKETMVERSKEL